MAQQYRRPLVCLCATALLFSACGGGDEALQADGRVPLESDSLGFLEAGPSLACGPGTHEQAGYCVPDSPSPSADAGITSADTTSAPADAKTSTRADAETSKSPDVGSVVVVSDGPCRSNDDCVAPALCSLSGACEERPASQCGLPQTGDCGCGASQTCVPLAFELEKGTTTYVPYKTGCYPACDPCAPSCDPGKICIALPEGGGFCHFGELAVEKEACGGLGKKACAGGLTCHVDTCLKLCVPDDLAFIGESSVTVQSVAASKDCPAGSYCRRSRSSSSSDGNFTCVAGTLGETGYACGTGNVLCAHPNRCLGVCTPTDCSCPAGIDCFTLSKNICIADGAISLGGRCAEDRNCQAGLRCVDGPYYKICALL